VPGPSVRLWHATDESCDLVSMLRPRPKPMLKLWLKLWARLSSVSRPEVKLRARLFLVSRPKFELWELQREGECGCEAAPR